MCVAFRGVCPTSGGVPVENTDWELGRTRIGMGNDIEVSHLDEYRRETERDNF